MFEICPGAGVTPALADAREEYDVSMPSSHGMNAGEKRDVADVSRLEKTGRPGVTNREGQRTLGRPQRNHAADASAAICRRGAK